MNWHDWIRQPPLRSKIMPGGTAVWEVGAQSLSGRPQVNDFVPVSVDTAYGVTAGSRAASVLVCQMPKI